MNSKKSIKKIVITGGAGYIGNTLIKSLPKDVEIIVVDNFTIDTDHKRLINKSLQKERKLTLVNANSGDVKKYEKYLKNVEVAIYMASLNSYRESNEKPLYYITENNIHLQKFLDALHLNSPSLKKLIVTSSRGVYGEGPYKCVTCKKRFYPDLSENITCTFCASKKVHPTPIVESDIPNPSSYYGVTKKLQEDFCEIYAKLHNVPLDILRIFNVYGEDQGKYYSNIGIVPQIFEQIKTKGEMYMTGNGLIARDFVHVNDVVTILADCVYSKNKRESLVEKYNVGSGVSTSILDIASFFESRGYKFKKNKTKEYKDIKSSVANNSKAKKVFGIKKFADLNAFLKNNYEKIN